MATLKEYNMLGTFRDAAFKLSEKNCNWFLFLRAEQEMLFNV
jgi:hypothetical protein